jgi:hypothetical protein
LTEQDNGLIDQHTEVQDFLRYIGLICQHMGLGLFGFKLVWLAAMIWNQYNSLFTGKLDQLHKAIYQDIETRFPHYCIVVLFVAWEY